MNVHTLLPAKKRLQSGAFFKVGPSIYSFQQGLKATHNQIVIWRLPHMPSKLQKSQFVVTTIVNKNMEIKNNIKLTLRPYVWLLVRSSMGRRVCTSVT